MYQVVRSSVLIKSKWSIFEFILQKIIYGFAVIASEEFIRSSAIVRVFGQISKKIRADELDRPRGPGRWFNRLESYRIYFFWRFYAAVTPTTPSGSGDRSFWSQTPLIFDAPGCLRAPLNLFSYLHFTDLAPNRGIWGGSLLSFLCRFTHRHSQKEFLGAFESGEHALEV